MDLSASLIEIIQRLEEWRRYPKYALERRIDIFLTPFLAPYLAQRMEALVELVAPEFPLKREGNAQSTNVDYLLYRDGGSRGAAWVFLELKTDDRSFRDKQLATYLALSGRPFAEVVEAVEKGIVPKSKQRAKYEELLARVRGEASQRDRLRAPIEIAYLSPNRPAEDPRVKWFPLGKFATWDPPVHRELWARLRPLIATVGEES